jgi:hypothetical protein
MRNYELWLQKLSAAKRLHLSVRFCYKASIGGSACHLRLPLLASADNTAELVAGLLLALRDTASLKLLGIAIEAAG